MMKNQYNIITKSRITEIKLLNIFIITIVKKIQDEEKH